MEFYDKKSILYLTKAFELIFGHTFSPKVISDQILISNMTFLLAIKAFRSSNLSSYGFNLYTTGVSSTELNEDIRKIDFVLKNNQKYPAIELSNSNMQIVKEIKKAVDKKPAAETTDWIRTIASITYIKEYAIQSDATKADLFKALEAKKVAFSDDKLNQKAYSTYEELMHITDPRFIIQTNFVKIKSPALFRKIIEECTDPRGSLRVRTVSAGTNTERQYKYGFTGAAPILGFLKEDINDPCKPTYSFDDFIKAVQSVLEDGETLKILTIEHDANYARCPDMTMTSVTIKDYFKNKLVGFEPDWLEY